MNGRPTKLVKYCFSFQARINHVLSKKEFFRSKQVNKSRSRDRRYLFKYRIGKMYERIRKIAR